MFAHTLISSIRITREVRQRRDLPEIPELAESISRLGLINPITLASDGTLIAGERRLEACRSLGWTHIPTQTVSDISEHDKYAIELEENIKRVDLPWQERVAAIETYHSMRKSEVPDWSQEDTAASLGLSQGEVSKQILVATEMAANPKLAEAPKLSVAYGIASRQAGRKKDEALLELQKTINPTAPVRAEPEATIINADFNRWAPTYSGPRFNFIHTDFPYGIGADSFAQGSAAAHGGYADSEETYWTLCKTLCDNLDRLASPDSHFIFWFSMKFYLPTLQFFNQNSDIVFDPFPLIWMKTDNVGILPDPSRGPRRIYETALFGRRGDRPVVQAVANAYGAPTVRNTHMSEKPEPVLRHFFRMVVDKTSLVLDPTSGSGSAIRAAESLGATHVRGLEINPEFAARAELELRKSRTLRAAE